VCPTLFFRIIFQALNHPPNNIIPVFRKLRKIFCEPYQKSGANFAKAERDFFSRPGAPEPALSEVEGSRF
jgi:hypothetical protein